MWFQEDGLFVIPGRFFGSSSSRQQIRHPTLCSESGIPEALFGGSEIAEAGGGGYGIGAGVGRTLQAGLTVESVMEIEPEAAMKFEDGKRGGLGFFLSRAGERGKQERQQKSGKRQGQARETAGGRKKWAHEKGRW